MEPLQELVTLSVTTGRGFTVTVILKVLPAHRLLPVLGVTINSTLIGANVLLTNVGLKAFLGVTTASAPEIPDGIETGVHE